MVSGFDEAYAFSNRHRSGINESDLISLESPFRKDRSFGLSVEVTSLFTNSSCVSFFFFSSEISGFLRSFFVAGGRFSFVVLGALTCSCLLDNDILVQDTSFLHDASTF